MKGPITTAYTIGRIVAGTLAGLFATEVAIRLFVTTGSTPVPDIRSDAVDDTVVEWRQIEEGVATSHFTVHGGRVTGNPPARNGSVAVIMGDSYVLALQVADQQTMGSRLEARARS